MVTRDEESEEEAAALTRAGVLAVDSEGYLTCSGHRLQDSLQIDPEAVSFKVHEDGLVEQELADGTTTEAGRLTVYQVPSPALLQPGGDHLYLAREELSGSPQPVEEVHILTGYLEASNVELAAEITNLVLLQRAFQLNARALQASDEMWQIVNNLKE
jgi:flagellar basal-body rod protein FlgG